LAAQLQAEADTRIGTLHAEQSTKERQYAETLAAARAEADQLRAQLQQVESSLQQEESAYGHSRTELQRETIARHTAEQQAVGLKERLAENEAHRQSLEEKHQHAREALDHCRQSVKEQRDQDQRRHEQQVQQLQAEMRQLQQSLVVKQEDVSRLNQNIEFSDGKFLIQNRRKEVDVGTTSFGCKRCQFGR
jgi:chromosome segregation ATPase